MKNLFKKFYSNRTKKRYEIIHKKLHAYTMIPKANFISNLSLAERVREIEGSIVECGVWKGGMIAGMASLLGKDRKYYLFDSFEGLPPAREIDGCAAIEWQLKTDSPGYFDNCSAAKEIAAQAMAIAGCSNYELVAGWFDQTLPHCDLREPIALLRLDGDWYDSTMTCLEVLFDKVAHGGLILIDDYHVWDGCSRAVHDFLSKRSAVERIDSYQGVCFIRKK